MNNIFQKGGSGPEVSESALGCHLNKAEQLTFVQKVLEWEGYSALQIGTMFKEKDKAKLDRANAIAS